jgi:hypothetical protein
MDKNESFFETLPLVLRIRSIFALVMVKNQAPIAEQINEPDWPKYSRDSKEHESLPKRPCCEMQPPWLGD